MSANPFRSILAYLCLALAGISVIGCTSQRPADDERDGFNAWQLGPLVDDNGHHRSLALDSPQQADLRAMQPWLADASPWYASRNDVGPSVTAGLRTYSYTRSLTTRRDRQDSFNGRIQDNYGERTTTQRYLEITR